MNDDEFEKRRRLVSIELNASERALQLAGDSLSRSISKRTRLGALGGVSADQGQPSSSHAAPSIRPVRDAPKRSPSSSSSSSSAVKSTTSTNPLAERRARRELSAAQTNASGFYRRRPSHSGSGRVKYELKVASSQSFASRYSQGFSSSSTSSTVLGSAATYGQARRGAGGAAGYGYNAAAARRQSYFREAGRLVSAIDKDGDNRISWE